MSQAALLLSLHKSTREALVGVSKFLSRGSAAAWRRGMCSRGGVASLSTSDNQFVSPWASGHDNGSAATITAAPTPCCGRAPHPA